MRPAGIPRDHWERRGTCPFRGMPGRGHLPVKFPVPVSAVVELPWQRGWWARGSGLLGVFDNIQDLLAWLLTSLPGTQLYSLLYPQCLGRCLERDSLIPGKSEEQTT
ncbi:PREDICTED: uncharacterized protein LOC105596646 isoform X1 [Cercocebus atys]|uniref:uncharacterized protein LOC105596646 isoform X1 n=1 Tax=Cercocebus atys TaxID=9531 RepID=UPI0005F3A5FC|nr:PREDICTED: uncharacterized protein LOC105596646 isoform X1 [Cercocebus atys]